MLEDLLISTQKVEINNKSYSLEYDHKSYAMLEILTGKGLFRIKEMFLNSNNLSFQDSIEMICCACLKHHSEKEISELRDYLLDNLGVISTLSQCVLCAFIKPLMPPDVMQKFQDDLKKKTSKKKKKSKKNMIG